jgi:hypothetical protein
MVVRRNFPIGREKIVLYKRELIYKQPKNIYTKAPTTICAMHMLTLSPSPPGMLMFVS